MRQLRLGSFIAPYFLLACVLGIACWYEASHTGEELAILNDRQNRDLFVHLPYGLRSKDNIANYVFRIEATHGKNDPTVYRVIADDCLTRVFVNNRDIPLKLPLNGCEWATGYYISLGKYLQPGSNELKFKVRDKGGAVYFNAYPAPLTGEMGLLLFVPLFAVCSMLAMHPFFRIQNIPREMQWILFLSFCLYGLHYFCSGLETKSYDAPGHLSYIHYISQYLSLPRPNAGWQMYQPPLYHILMSLPDNVLDKAGIHNFFARGEALRLVSYGFYLVFLAYSVLLIRRLVNGRFMQTATLCLFAFWPIGIAHATRINNDILIYAEIAAALYYLMHWHETRERKFLIATILLFGLSMLTKTTGIIIGAMLALVIIAQPDRRTLIPALLRNRAMLAALAAAALLAGFNTARVIHNNAVLHANQPLVVSNIYQGDKGMLLSDNSLFYYFTFDLKTYFTQPFYNIRDDATGRLYFWNSLLKTALLGEFVWQSPFLALSAAALLLAMTLYVIFTYACHATLSRGVAFPAAMLALMIISALFFNRLQYAHGGLENVRYVFPLVLLFCIFLSRAVAIHERAGRQAVATGGKMLLLAFLAACLALILAEYASYLSFYLS